jgi:hypothetical protein
MLDDPAHGGGGSIGIGGGGSGPDDGAAAPDPARRLPSDLPTSLDDRRLPAEPVSETEMYDGWQGAWWWWRRWRRR